MKRAVLLALIALLLATTFAFGQQTTGQINGTLTDSSGAVVPNAKVTAKNKDNGQARSSVSSSSGAYTITDLAPGNYSLTTEATGFAKTVNENVSVLVGQALTLNFTLKTGGANEIITVTEEAPLIESSKSEIGGSVSPLEVKELPIVDRNFAGLMMTVPGVRPAEAFDPTKTRSGNVSVNGSDGRSIDYNVDGGDNKDTVIGGIVQNFTMEGIQEFQVVTDRYTAESGRAAAAVVNVISKSGTNQYHGTAFGLFQNSGLNAIDYFSDKNGERKPKFHRYQFGGSAGGPIIKDKLFFFGAYEQKREPGAIPANPTSFQGLQEFATAFPSYAVPVSSLPFPFLDQEATFKLDHTISSKQTMFYRYAREKWTNPNDQLGDPINADASQSTSDTNNFHDLVIQHNYTFSPTKVNSFNVHFQDFVNAILPSPGRTFTYPVAGGGSATNPEICFGAANGCGGGVPEVGNNVNVPQETLIRKYQFRDDFTWIHGNHNMKMGVNWDYVAKMGGYFYFGANGYQVTFWDNPQTIVSNPAYTNGFSTPGAVAEITYSGGSGSTAQAPWHQLAFYYQDDWKVTPHFTLNAGIRWDANPGFLVPQLTNSFNSTNRTINILREVLAAGISDPTAAAGVARAQELASDTSLLQKTTADWKEFQPRVGFSWDPTGGGKTVIRGGFGVARDTIFQNLTLFAVQETNPTIYNTIIDQLSSGAPGSPGGCSGPLCTFRFGIDPLPAPAASVTDLAPGAIGRMEDPRLTDPWSEQMSIGGEHQFGDSYALSADYYHVLGTHEPRVLNMNPKIGSICNPTYGGNASNPVCVNGADTRLMDAAFADTPGVGAGRLGAIYDYSTTNRSLYDGINFQLRKRMSHRFQFQASYVLSWSRSWGGRPTSSYSGSGINVTPEQQFASNEFGYTSFDERHRFTLSGVFMLPWGIELAPLIQAASARPYDFLAGSDINGDGRSTIDRVCVGTPTSGITAAIVAAAQTPGCTMMKPNALRGDPFFQTDLRTSKTFQLGERASLQIIWEFYNLTNKQNFCNNYDGSIADWNANPAQNNFRVPQGYCGGQGGPAFTGPFRQQFGLRFAF